MTTSTWTLLSWNVNGVRAAQRKGFIDWFHQMAPDVLCLQDRGAGGTIARNVPESLPATMLSGMEVGHVRAIAVLLCSPGSWPERKCHLVWASCEFDQEGRGSLRPISRFHAAELLLSQRQPRPSPCPFKLAFYEAFLALCERLHAEGRAVIFCGDVNAAHREIDLAHPKANQNNTGFLPEERAWIDEVLAAGYVDTFRHFYPELKEQYTWWSMPTLARERNVGWRLDYFFAAREVMPRVPRRSFCQTSWAAIIVRWGSS